MLHVDDPAGRRPHQDVHVHDVEVVAQMAGP
jgi:hypothetical protein